MMQTLATPGSRRGGIRTAFAPHALGLVVVSLLSAGPALAQSCPPFQEFKVLENEYKSLKYDVLPAETNVIARCTYAKKLQEIDNRQAAVLRRASGQCSGSLMFRNDVDGTVGHTREIFASSIAKARIENRDRVALECRHVAEVERSLADEERGRRGATRVPRPSAPGADGSDAQKACDQFQSLINTLARQGNFDGEVSVAQQARAANCSVHLRRPKNFAGQVE